MTGCSFLVILNLSIFFVKISIQGIWNAITKEESSSDENDKNAKIKSNPNSTPYELPKDYQHNPESGLGKSTLINSLFLTDLYPGTYLKQHLHALILYS